MFADVQVPPEGCSVPAFVITESEERVLLWGEIETRATVASNWLQSCRSANQQTGCTEGKSIHITHLTPTPADDGKKTLRLTSSLSQASAWKHHSDASHSGWSSPPQDPRGSLQKHDNTRSFSASQINTVCFVSAVSLIRSRPLQTLPRASKRH